MTCNGAPSETGEFESKNETTELVSMPADLSALREATLSRLGESESANHQGFAIRDGDTLLGGLWVATRKFCEPDLGLRYDLGESTGWIYSVYVDKAYRKRGVYRAALATVLDQLPKLGIQNCLVAVNPWNRPSWKAHKRHSQQRLGSVFVIRLLGIGICWTNGNIRCMRRGGASWLLSFEL